MATSLEGSICKNRLLHAVGASAGKFMPRMAPHQADTPETEPHDFATTQLCFGPVQMIQNHNMPMRYNHFLLPHLSNSEVCTPIGFVCAREAHHSPKDWLADF